MFKKFTHKKSQERQLNFLTQSERLEESEDPILIRLTLGAASACILGFVIWASVTNVNEVARAPGEIAPQGLQQVVQHLEGGIVSKILVQEGQSVDQGQLLMTIDGNGAQEDLNRAQSHQVALELQKERLRAFLDARQPDFARFQKAASPMMIADQNGIFAAMTQARDKESAIILDQIRQKRETLKALQSRLSTVERNIAVTKDMYDRRKTLQQGGYVSQISFLQSEREMNEARGQGAELSAQANEAKAALAEYAKRLESLNAGSRDDAYRQLEGVDNELSLNADLIRKAQDRVARLDVRAPVRGLVKGLSVNTIGAVVQPGQVLMEVVPLDKPLVAEVRIPPRHIGHIHPGQPVQLKVSAYDFARYGALPGTLESISPSTFEGSAGERFYKGRVILSHNYVGHSSGNNMLMPGMTVMADVVTGDKTIMDYLLKPIALNLKTAFTER